MSRVIVFGGSFNPPTKAHIAIALEAKKFLNADKVIFMPVGNAYGKRGIIDAKYRVQMLSLCCGDEEVSLIEVESSRRLRTVETLGLLREKYKNSEIYFLMGADNLLDVVNWYKWNELLEEYNILAIDRDSMGCFDLIYKDSLLSRYKDNIKILKFSVGKKISSTLVRECVCQGDYDIGDYVTEEVRDFIIDKKLYIGDGLDE